MGVNRYISDLHFGHANILKFDRRPFQNTDHMEHEFIKRWNEVTANDDTVYILGDFCWGKEADWLGLVQLLNGNKVLIRGNHDLKSMSKELRAQFLDVADYKEITDSGRHIIMSHYPQLLYKGAYDPKCYMLCGHVHTTRENDFLKKWRSELRRSRSDTGHSFGNIINVGCMLPYIDYTPRTLDEMLEHGALEDDCQVDLGVEWPQQMALEGWSIKIPDKFSDEQADQIIMDLEEAATVAEELTGCEHCRDDAWPTLCSTEDVDFRVADKHVYCYDKGTETWACQEINFCPWCGRYLGGN